MVLVSKILGRSCCTVAQLRGLEMFGLNVQPISERYHGSKFKTLTVTTLRFPNLIVARTFVWRAPIVEPLGLQSMRRSCSDTHNWYDRMNLGTEWTKREKK